MNNQLEQDFESLKHRFVSEWEAGMKPTLQSYVRAYPQWAQEITEFVLQFVAMENAAERVTESPVAADSTLKLIRKTVERTSAPARNLSQAREQRGWTVRGFAQKLNLPNTVVLRMVRGVREWPEKLEAKLAEALFVSRSEVQQLIENSKPISATAYKATQQPVERVEQRPTWREVLNECADDFTDEQRQEWL